MSNERTIKAFELIAAGSVRRLSPSHYEVQGQHAPYIVNLDAPGTCTCPDYTYRHAECKHIKAARLATLLDAELEEFLARRPDVQLADIPARMRDAARPGIDTPRNDLMHAHHRAMAARAEVMIATRTAQAEHKRALAFQVHYWWPGVDAERVLDPLDIAAPQYVANLRVKFPGNPDYRQAVAGFESVLEYVQANGLEFDTPKPLNKSGAGWNYELNVFKPAGE